MALALFGASLLAFGAVHTPVRLALGVGCGLIGGAILCTEGGPPRSRSFGLALLTLVGLDILAHGVSVDFAQHGGMLGRISDPLGVSLRIVSEDRWPLVLDPHQFWVGQVVVAGMATLGIAVASVVTESRRARQVGLSLAAIGSLFAIFGVVQQILGVPSVLGLSRYAGSGEFFGTLVNNNHGGAVCAALLPWSIGLGRSAKENQLKYWAMAFSMAAGVWASGSRGALLVAAVGIVVFALLDRSDRARRIGWGAVGLTVVLGSVVGPRALFENLTKVVEPDRYYASDLYSGRLEVYRDAWLLVPHAPLGLGVGSFEDAYHFVKTWPGYVTMNQAHSDLLQLLIERGPFLTIGFLGLAVASVWFGLSRLGNARKERRDMLVAALASAASLWAFGLFDFPSRIGSLFCILALDHGVILGLSHNESRGERPSMPVGGVALAGLTLLSFCFFLSRPSSFGEVEQGDRAMAAGRLEAAEGHYLEALARRPLYYRALMRLARTRLAMGKVEDAQRLLVHATRIWPTHHQGWLQLARLERGRTNLDASAEAYRNLLRLDYPESSQFALLREALSLYPDPLVSALNVLPERPDRWCQAGAALARTDRGISETLYREGVRLNDTCRLWYAHDLTALWSRPDEAIEIMTGVEDGCAARRVWGRIAYLKGDPAGAVKHLEGALSVCSQDNVFIRFLLAQARADLGDSRGIENMEEICGEAPSDDRIRVLIRYLDEAGRPAEAARWLGVLVSRGHATGAETRRHRRLRMSP